MRVTSVDLWCSPNSRAIALVQAKDFAPLLHSSQRHSDKMRQDATRCDKQHIATLVFSKPLSFELWEILKSHNSTFSCFDFSCLLCSGDSHHMILLNAFECSWSDEQFYTVLITIWGQCVTISYKHIISYIQWIQCVKSTSDSTSDSVWFHVMSRSRPEAQHGPLLHPRPMGLSQHGSRLEKHRRVRMNCVCRVCRLSVDAQIAIHNCQALQCFMLENGSLFGWMYNNCSGGHKFVANFWLSVASYARACGKEL